MAMAKTFEGEAKVGSRSAYASNVVFEDDEWPDKAMVDIIVPMSGEGTVVEELSVERTAVACCYLYGLS